MRPALRKVLFWSGISLAAVVVGAPLGIGYSLYMAAEEPAAAPRLLDPLLVSPRDGAFTSLTPTLKWGGDPLGGHFEIEISGQPGDTRAERHTTAENFFTREEPFAPGARVSWRARAVGADGAQSPWSATWTFTPLPGP